MNNLKLVAAVAVTAVVTDTVTRFRINKKNQDLSPHYRALIETNKLLIEQFEVLVPELDKHVKANALLLHQNRYLISMIDRHDVTITEFDHIAMNNLPETEE